MSFPFESEMPQNVAIISKRVKKAAEEMAENLTKGHPMCKPKGLLSYANTKKEEENMKDLEGKFKVEFKDKGAIIKMEAEGYKKEIATDCQYELGVPVADAVEGIFYKRYRDNANKERLKKAKEKVKRLQEEVNQ